MGPNGTSVVSLDQGEKVFLESNLLFMNPGWGLLPSDSLYFVPWGWVILSLTLFGGVTSVLWG